MTKPIKLPEGHKWKEISNSDGKIVFKCRCGATFTYNEIDGSTNFEESGYNNCLVYQFPIIFKDTKRFTLITEENDTFNMFVFKNDEWTERGTLTFDEIDTMVGRLLDAGIDVFTKLNLE